MESAGRPERIGDRLFAVSLPARGIDQSAVPLDAEERTAIQVEPFADAFQRLAHGGVHPFRGQVDELGRHVGDEPLELVLSRDSRKKRRLRFWSRGDVYHGGEHEADGVHFHRAHGDFHSKPGPVAALPEQFGACARGSRRRRLHECFAIGVVHRAEGTRQHDFHMLPEEFPVCIAELPFQLMVSKENGSVTGHEHDAAR